MKNRIQLNFFGIVALLLLAGFILMNIPKINIRAENVNIEDEKILQYYHEPLIDEDFENNKINVILKNSYANTNEIGLDDFEVTGKISEISSITYNSETIERGNRKKFILQGEKNPIFVLNVTTNSKEKILETIKDLQSLDMVLVAEPSYIYATKSTWVPSDSNYSLQWGLNGTYGINAESLWNISTGSLGVKIGIMENGIDMNHEDLKGRVFEGNSSNLLDTDLSHGTHVAGIIGAIQNDYGISGISQSAMYLLNRDMLSALSYATQNNIKIINASFVYEIKSTGEYAPFNATDYTAIKNYDGLLVCGAGNDNSNSDIYKRYPADYDLPNVISVGALTQQGKRAGFSTYGEETVQIYAPGEDILSAYPSNLCESGECLYDSTVHYKNGYHYNSGTSMAAPHVTGVAALMLSVEPKLSASRIKDILLSTAHILTISTPDGNQYIKKLNGYKAVEYVSQPHNLLFGGGTGMAYDPYLISTEEQFRNMGLAHRPVYVTYQGYEEQINYYFKLTNDITLSGDWTTFPYKFSGEFDGGDHSITYSMTLTQSDMNTGYFGLFGFVTSPGKIMNLKLTDCRITSDVNTTLTCSERYPSIGILAGTFFEIGSIEHITVSDPYICCNISDALIGGIAGSASRTSFSDCNVSGGEIISYSGRLGGMIGSVGTNEINLITGGSCNTTIRKYNYSDEDLIGPIVGNSTEHPKRIGGNVDIDKVAPCVAIGTLITLADGRQVPVETLTGDETLLVWNLQTGAFDTAPILFIDSDPWKSYKVINLAFSDGTGVKVIYEHGFWDYDLNKYVYLREDAAQYIGHWFNKQALDESGGFVTERVRLIGVDVREEYTATYSPVTYGHLCYYVNGMLSMPGGIEGLFNVFEADAGTMSYDTALMQADIEEYGLFTYEEFFELVPVSEEVFGAFNGQYLKVAIGKGMITVEQLQRLAVRYGEFF